MIVSPLARESAASFSTSMMVPSARRMRFSMGT